MAVKESDSAPPSSTSRQRPLESQVRYQGSPASAGAGCVLQCLPPSLVAANAVTVPRLLSLTRHRSEFEHHTPSVLPGVVGRGSEVQLAPPDVVRTIPSLVPTLKKQKLAVVHSKLAV